ncbi:MAG: SRPBCC family protein [Myxococcales bacterium]|nr:SRPBCC family protein [Myxococcales bacterium]
MLLAVSVALAAPPEVERRADGAFVGQVVVEGADPDGVRAKLADPAWVATASGGATEVTATEARDGCLRTSRLTRNAIKDVVYVVDRCPTADGYAEKLVSSNAFDAYVSTWAVRPDPGGARIIYTIDMKTSLMVPQFVVDQQTRKGVIDMLDHLRQAF